MARARSLKPGFFTNEDLIELPFEYRLLFAGLWTLADRAGRLEDRPKRIKLNVFPGDNVDCDAGLSALAERKFIERYSVGGIRYIQVLAWAKHQSPHVKEASSTIPAPCENSACTSVAALTPSSLTPDSPFSDSGSLRSPPSASATPANNEPEWFDEFKREYPNRSGDQGWRKAQRAAHARIAEGHTPAEFIDGARRYAAFCEATQKTGTEFVKQACSFLGPDKPFSLAWIPPPSKAQVRQDKNISASLQWLAEEEAKDAARRSS